MENYTVALYVGDNVTTLIQQLATQIGVTADKVFPWYVTQMQLEGLMFFFIVSILLLIFLPLFGVGVRKADWDKGNGAAWIALSSAILLLFVVIGVTAGSTVAITKLKNPELHAMRAMVEDVSRLVPGK
jgi:hypothetical protein